MFSSETMQIDQGLCYQCCSKCKGLFSSGDDHLKHSIVCNGNPFKSTSLHFACERKIYLQLFQSEDFQSDGTLNQLSFSKDDSFLDHVVKIKMPQDVFDPSIFLRNNTITSLQTPTQDTGFVLESGSLSLEENKVDEEYLAGKKPRFSECIEQDQLRKIINKNIDYLKNDEIPALSSQTNKELHFSSSRSESRLLSPIDKHFLSDLPKSRVQSPFEKCMNYLQDTGSGFQTGPVSYASNQSIPFSCNLTTDLLGGLASTGEENMTSVDDLPTLQYLDLAKKDIFLGQNPGLNQINSKDPFLINATVKPERPMSSGPRIQTQSSKSCEDLQNSPTFPIQPLQDANYFSFPSTLDEPTQLDYLDLATLDFLTNPSSFGVYGLGTNRDRFLSDREDIYSECNFLFHDQDINPSENVLQSEKTSLDDTLKFNKSKMKRISLKKAKRGVEKKKKQSPARKKSLESKEEAEFAQNLQFEALTDSLGGRSVSNKKNFKRTYSAEYEQIKTSLYTRKRKLMSSSETLSFRISPDAKRKAKAERKLNESQRLCSSNTILNVKESLVGYSEEEKKSMTGVFGQMGCFIVKKNKYGSKSCSAVDQIITEVSSAPGEGKLVVLEGTSCPTSALRADLKCSPFPLADTANGNGENVKSVLKLKCQHCTYNTTSVADFKYHKTQHEQINSPIEKDKSADKTSSQLIPSTFTATPMNTDSDSENIQQAEEARITDNNYTNADTTTDISKVTEPISSSESMGCNTGLLELCDTNMTTYEPNSLSMESLIDCNNQNTVNKNNEFNEDMNNPALKLTEDFAKVVLFEVESAVQDDTVSELTSTDSGMIPSQEINSRDPVYNESDRATINDVSPSPEMTAVTSGTTSVNYRASNAEFTVDETIAAPSFGDNFTIVYDANIATSTQPENFPLVQTNFADTLFPNMPTHVNSTVPNNTEPACTMDLLDESEIATSVLAQEILPKMISETQDSTANSQDSWTDLVSKPIEGVQPSRISFSDTVSITDTVSEKLILENKPEENNAVKMKLVDQNGQFAAHDFRINEQNVEIQASNNTDITDISQQQTIIVTSRRHSVPSAFVPDVTSYSNESPLHNQSSFTVLRDRNKDDQESMFTVFRKSNSSMDINKTNTSSCFEPTIQQNVQQGVPVLDFRNAVSLGLLKEHKSSYCRTPCNGSNLPEHVQEVNKESSYNLNQTENTDLVMLQCENNHSTKVDSMAENSTLNDGFITKNVKVDSDIKETLEGNGQQLSCVASPHTPKHVSDVGVQCTDAANNTDDLTSGTAYVEDTEKPTELMLSTPAGIVHVDHCYGQVHPPEKLNISPQKAGTEKKKVCSFSEAVSEESTFECGHCDFTTSNKSVMKNHVVKHEGVYLYCHVPECDFKTMYKRGLNAHLLKHNSEHMLLCDQCAFTTSDANNLKRHQQDKHYYVNRFKCSECDHMSMFRERVAKHYRHTHLQEKIYACNQCDYRTGYTHLLKFHLMAHAGIRPYKCSACDYQVNNINKVTRHIKTRHQDEEGIRCEKLDLDFEVDARQFQCESKTCDKDINIIELTEEQAKELTQKCDKKSKRNKNNDSNKEKDNTTDIPVFNPRKHQPKRMVSLLGDKTKLLGNLNTQSQTSSYKLPRINIVQLPQDQYKIVNRNCNVVVNRRSIDDIYVPVRNKVEYNKGEELSNSKLIRKNVSVESLIHSQGETSYGEREFHTEYQCSMCDYTLKSHDDIAQHLLICDMEKNKII